MSTYADDVRISSGPGAPASEDTDISPSEAGAAESDHHDCPYCGDTGREQVRRYRFCGHEPRDDHRGDLPAERGSRRPARPVPA